MKSCNGSLASHLHRHVRVILIPVLMSEMCQAKTSGFLSTTVRVEQIRHELSVGHEVEAQLGSINSEELPYPLEPMYGYLRAGRLIQQSSYGAEFYLGDFYTSLIFGRPVETYNYRMVEHQRSCES
jgi:hypothetical protein